MDLSGGTLLVFDIFHAEVLIKALSIFAMIFPGLAVVLLVYYLVSSFALVFMTDQLYHRWVVRVILAIFMVNLAVGGVFSGFVLRNTTPDAVRVAAITKIMTFKNAGNGAEKTTVDAFGSVPFEAFAYLGEIENLAFDSGGNLAGTRVSADAMSVYVLTRQTVSQRGDLSFGPAWDVLNYRLQRMPALGSAVLYLSNSFSSLAYSAAKLVDNESVLETLGTGGWENWFAWKTKDDADEQSPVYAAASLDGGGSNASAYVGTLNDYPGGPATYGAYILRRASEPSLLFHARAADAEEIIAKANGQDPSSSSAAADRLYEEAVAHGYEADIAPDIYARTHMAEFDAQCRADLDMSPGARSYGSTGVLAALNPCKIVVQKLAGRHSGDLTKGLGDAAQDAYDRLFGSNSHLSALAGAVLTRSGLDIPVASPRKCEDISSLDSLEKAFKQWEHDSANIPAARSNTQCIKAGKNITAALIAMRNVARSNAQRYEDYIFQDSPWAVEDGGTAILAFAGGDNDGDGDGSGGGQGPNENLADLGSALRSMLQPLSDGLQLPSSVEVHTPTSTVSQSAAQDPVMGEAGLDDAVVIGTLGAFAAKPGMMMRFTAWAGAGLKKAVTKTATAIGGAKLKILQAVVAVIPAVAILLSYSVVYYMAVFGAVLGLISVPLWAVFLLGKLFNGPGSGDEQYGGVSLFPVVQFVGSIALIAVELLVLGAASGLAMKFFATFGEFIGKFVAAVGLTMGTAMNPITDHVIGNPLGFITMAVKPLGIMLGLSLLPIFLYRVVTSQPYAPTMHPLQSPLSSLANSGAVMGAGFGALSAMNSTATKSGGASTSSASHQKTTLDAAVDAVHNGGKGES